MVEMPAYSQMIQASWPPPGRGLLVTKKLVRLGVVAEWARAVGCSMAWSSKLCDASGFSWVVLDLDTLGGPVEMIEELARIRVETPHVQIMVVSGDFSADDLGSERLAACDVSLKFPVSFERLEESMIWMHFNNLAWQKRVYQPKVHCSA